MQCNFYNYISKKETAVPTARCSGKAGRFAAPRQIQPFIKTLSVSSLVGIEVWLPILCTDIAAAAALRLKFSRTEILSYNPQANAP